MDLQRIAMTVVTGLVAAGSCKLACAQRTERASVDSAGTEGSGASYLPALSADGRFVAFQSLAPNLVSGDANGFQDIFVHDFQTGTTERVSVDSAGTEGNYHSYTGSITVDGRLVAFQSPASNLVSGDTNGEWDVFLHDRQTGTTERVSVDSTGAEGNRDCFRSSLNSDGRFVAFESFASNLVSGDSNGRADVFVRDRQAGTTERVSVDSLGMEGNNDSQDPSISADGRFVAFESQASNLVSGDTNWAIDVLVHDRQTGTTERVSVDSAGAEGNSSSEFPSISAAGRFVAFDSFASNLVSGDANGVEDVFVHDRQTGTTERVSVNSAGTEANSHSHHPSISPDGRFVAFLSYASNLVAGDTNGKADVFVHDRLTGTTERVSVDSAGTEGNQDCTHPTISADGRFVAFDGAASNLVSSDTNGAWDVFVHGPYLTLEADPPSPPAGATLTFTTWTGNANGLSLLVVTDLNGTPMFLPVVLGSFDASGLWTLSGAVPSGLSGNVITFETLGFVPTGKVDVSNPVTVSFQ